MGKKSKKKESRSSQSERQKAQNERDAQLQKITTYTGVAVIVLIVAAIGIYVFSNQSSSGGADVQLSLEGQPTLGPADAPVEVIEFGDFKCPACKAFHNQVFTQLQRNYIDTGQIEFAFANYPLPLGQDSWTAADGAECVYQQAGNDAFWGYYNGVYINQGPESDTWATPDLLTQIAQDYTDQEIDTDRLRRCINNQEYRDDVDRDRNMAITANAGGTPAVYVNGRSVNPSYSAISAAIDEELGNTSE